MTNAIGKLGPVNLLPPKPGLAQPVAGDNAGFQNLLKNAIESTSQLQNSAQQSLQNNIAGGDVTNVEVLTDLRKADLAMRLMLQIRNKLLESFNEIKQMQF